MNIIVKSFLITLAIMSAGALIALSSIMPSWYGYIVLFIVLFGAIWFYFYVLLK